MINGKWAMSNVLGVARLRIDFPAGEGAGVLAVAGAEKGSAGGFGDSTNKETGSLNTGKVAALTEALAFTSKINLGLGGVGRIGAVLAVADDLRIVGVGEGGVEIVFLGAAGTIEGEGIGVFSFRVAGDFIQEWLEILAVTSIQNTGWGVAFVLAVIVFEGDFEVVDISFADGVEGFFELETVAEKATDKQNGDQGDDNEKFDESKSRPQSDESDSCGQAFVDRGSGHIYYSITSKLSSRGSR